MKAGQESHYFCVETFTLVLTSSRMLKLSTSTHTTTLIMHIVINNWKDEKKQATSTASVSEIWQDMRSRTMTLQSSPVMTCLRAHKSGCVRAHVYDHQYKG